MTENKMTRREVIARAREVAALIVSELRVRGRVARRLVHESFGDRASWHIQLDGTNVPLHFEEEVHSHHGGFNWTYTGKVKLRVGGVHIDYAVKLKAKYFKESVKREHGFDIVKLCDHIETWAEVYERETGQIAAREVVEELEGKYPTASKAVRLKATAKGSDPLAVGDYRCEEGVMSYEGYEQHICARGHWFEVPCSYGGDGDERCACGASSVWHNCVDDTNGEQYGVIPLEALATLKLTDEVIKTCDLGHQHVVKEATYRKPTDEEVERMRHYRNEERELVPLRGSHD